MSVYDIENLPQSITIGRQGEEHSKTLEFDISPWLEVHPAMQCAITMADGASSTSRLLTGVSQGGDILSWSVCKDATKTPGEGSIVIRGILIIDDGENQTVVEKRSAKVKTLVSAGHFDDADNPNSDITDWNSQEAIAAAARETTYLEAENDRNEQFDTAEAQRSEQFESAENMRSANSAMAVAAATQATDIIESGAGFLWREESISPNSIYPVPNSTLHIKVRGTLKQSGAGLPSPDNIRPILPWVRNGEDVMVLRTGKNLIPNAGETLETNGITFTVNEDGSVTVNGTATANASVRLAGGYTNTEPVLWYKGGVNYRLGKGNTTNGVSLMMYSRQSGVWNGVRSANDFVSDIGFSPSADGYITDIFVFVLSGSVVDHATVYPQLEIGSVATKYEQYAESRIVLASPDDIWNGWIGNDGEAEDEWAAKVLDGTEAWVLAPTDTPGKSRYHLSLTPMGKGVPSTAVGSLVCSHYAAITDDFCYIRNADHSAALDASGSLYLYDATYEDEVDTTAFKAYLAAQYAAGTPVTLAYRKAIPSKYAITAVPLAALPQADRITPRNNVVACHSGEVVTQYAKSPIRESDEIKAAITLLS